MADFILSLLLVLLLLSAMNVLDVTVDISPHVKGEKVLCIRGKSAPAEANGQ